MDPFIKIMIAVVLGGMIGFERQSRGIYAGFRTQILVCLGSCLFTIVSVQLPTIYGMSADPGRIAAQIVTGMGFLGAGAILRQKDLIRGLTTAACLWVVSAIGMTVGFGEYILATFAALFVLATLVIFKRLEDTFFQSRYTNIKVILKGTEGLDLKDNMKDRGVRILTTSFKLSMEQNQIEQNIAVEYKQERQLQEFLKILKSVPGLIELQTE